uniref:60S ribosomal protein L23a n=1 Tax=Cricetulus griseus TaxID=10029 RepID=A0A8C2M278_CRIGR
MSSKDLPSLQELAGQSLLRNENLAISPLGKLPNVLLPQLFKQAYEGGHRNVPRKIVSSWPFPQLPLRTVKKRNALETLENDVLEEVDKLLIQSPREYKLEVLDLQSVCQTHLDVQSGPIDYWLPQTSCEMASGEKQPLKVAVNLYLRNGSFNKLFCLSQWAEKRKGLLQLYCYKFQIWLPSLSDCKCFLEYVNLQHIVALGLHSLHNPAEFLDLTSYLGHLMNLHKLSISDIQEERFIALEERRNIISGFLQRQPKYPRKSAPRRNKLDHYAIIKFLLTTESAMKKIEDNNTLVFIVDVKTNKHQIKQAVKKLYDIDVTKVNTLIRPEEEKKAYVWLAPDYDALDVANKIGII